MKLSVIIPAHNEEDDIEKVVWEIFNELSKENITHEIIIIDDNSSDNTSEIGDRLANDCPTVRTLHRIPPRGFGRAVREGLANIEGDAVVIVMGDASDDPKDVVKYFQKIEQGYDCVFGSRFVKGSIVRDYPLLKLIVNRTANMFIRCLFWIKENDITNAFKAYRAEVIRAITPLEANYFNITIELPLKAIVKGFSRTTVPVNWHGRRSGVSKLSIREMGRKYLYTVLTIWLRKFLLKDEL